MGEILLAELPPAHIARWRDERLKVVVGATVNRDMNLVSNILTVARKEWNWIGESPTKEVRRPKDSPPRNRRILDDEIDRLCVGLGFADDEPVTTKSQAVAVAFLLTSRPLCGPRDLQTDCGDGDRRGCAPACSTYEKRAEEGYAAVESGARAAGHVAGA
jgi:hypothetical protein